MSSSSSAGSRSPTKTVEEPVVAPAGLARYERLLTAALAKDASALRAYADWAAQFDSQGPVDPGDYGLLSVVSFNLSQQALTPVDDAIWPLLRGITRRTWSANNLRLETLKRVLHAFDRVGAGAIVETGAITIISELNDLASVAIDRVDVTIRPEHAQRCVAALLALGASSQLALEPLLTGREQWRTECAFTLDACHLVVNWNRDTEGCTTSERSVGTTNIRTRDLSGRIWSYLAMTMDAISSGQLNAETTTALVGLHATISEAESADESSWVTTLATHADRAGKRNEAISVLSWLGTVVGDIPLRDTVALLVNIPSGPVQSSTQPLEFRSPANRVIAPVRAIPATLLRHIRYYRTLCRRNGTNPSTLGFVRYFALRCYRAVIERV